jgi:hypothetical protein
MLRACANRESVSDGFGGNFPGSGALSCQAELPPAPIGARSKDGLRNLYEGWTIEPDA